MPPLTSPSGCDGCVRLNLTISELEKRISILYQLREEEQLLDSLVTVGRVVTTTEAAELDSTVRCFDTVADQPQDHWTQLGAKPKSLASSTPSHSEPWIAAGKGNHGGKLLSRSSPKLFSRSSPPQDLQLSSRFSILDERDFPPLSRQHTPPPSPGFDRSPSRPSTADHRSQLHIPPVRPGSMQFTPHPTAGPRRARRQRHTPPPGNNKQSIGPVPPPVQPSEPPSPVTLVVGDSIVRHIKSKSSITYCFPGAKVLDMVKKIPALLSDHPRARNIVIHIGANNTADCESEILKQDFISLFNLLMDCNRSVFISGPLPSFHRGIGRFSRLLSLNTWLQSVCSSHNAVLIDNFNLFWNRAPFFSRDGIHPSPHGSRALAANIFHAVTTNSHA